MASGSGSGFFTVIDIKHSELEKQWNKESMSVSVLLIGKTGAGKSSLINSLAGSEVARGDSSKTETVVQPHKIEYSEGNKRVELTLWDTPGLEEDERDSKATLRQIEAECNPTKVDLTLFCVPLNEKRIAKQDISTIVAYTEKFGVQMWDNAVIAFTCANEVQPNPQAGSSETQHDYFVRKLSTWRVSFHDALQTKAKVPKEKVRTIPTIPTGYRQRSLPDRYDWITILWACCYNRAKQAAQPGFIRISHFTKRFAEKNDVICEDKQEMEPQDRKVVVDRYSEEEIAELSGLHSVPREWRIIGGGAAGIAAGTTIGTLIGIVGGPVGVVLGAAMGSIVGGGIGALSGSSVERFLTKRRNPCHNDYM